MTEHIVTHKKLKDIPTLTSFNELLELSTLSPIDKQILRMHYLDDKNFAYIADSLGYAEITVITRHKKALQKLKKIL